MLLASPQRCAGLVARDLRVSGVGRTLEGARLFEARTTTGAGEVAGQLRRLVSVAGEHMPAADARRLRAAAEVAGDSGRGNRPAASLQASWSAIVKRTEQQQRTERVEFTDAATGALNERFLDTYLDSVGPRSPELAVAALLAGDTDTEGSTVRRAHDGALRAVADIARTSARPGDVVVRRGDQLLLVMPGVSVEDAQQVVTGVVRRAGELPAPVLLSAAVGVFPPAAVDVEVVVGAVRAARRHPDRLVVVDGDDARVASQDARGGPGGR